MHRPPTVSQQPAPQMFAPLPALEVHPLSTIAAAPVTLSVFQDIAQMLTLANQLVIRVKEPVPMILAAIAKVQLNA